MRDIIIGDIHGCSKPLQRLLDRIQPDPAVDRLVLLGDLFDRGPDSWEVLQIVKELERQFGERFVLLRGTHDDYLVQENLPRQLRAVWERVGRRTTVRSFEQHGERMEDASPWILEHSVIYYKGKDYQCVHAGLKIDPPEWNDNYTLMHDHEIVMENRYAGPLTIVGHIGLREPAWFAGDGARRPSAAGEGDDDSRGTVVSLQEDTMLALPDHGIICIDAGCGKGGRLIAMVIENKDYMLYGEAEKDGHD